MKVASGMHIAICNISNRILTTADIMHTIQYGPRVFVIHLGCTGFSLPHEVYITGTYVANMNILLHHSYVFVQCLLHAVAVTAAAKMYIISCSPYVFVLRLAIERVYFRHGRARYGWLPVPYWSLLHMHLLVLSCYKRWECTAGSVYTNQRSPDMFVRRLRRVRVRLSRGRRYDVLGCLVVMHVFVIFCGLPEAVYNTALGGAVFL